MARKKTDFLLNTGEELLILEQHLSEKEEIEKRMEVYSNNVTSLKEEQDGEGG